MNFKKLFQTLTGEEPQTTKEPVHQHNYFNDLPRPLTDIEKETYYRMSVQRTDADLTVHSEKGVAMDSAEDNNSASQGVYNNMVGAIPDIIYSHFAAQGFIGYNACAILKQNWMISNACTVPAEDAIQSGYTLCNKDDSETISEEELENFKAVSYSKYHIDDICRRIEINKKVFGIGLAVPCMDDDYDYENPFNIDGVKPNSYKGWTVVDPYWFAPELDEDAATNPASKNFYQPTWYRMPNGKRVHRSHCIVLMNSVIPDILKPTYFYGGIPLTQMIFQRVYAAEKVANEAPLLALTKRLLVVDANLENFVANQRDAEETLKTISWLRDNFGVAIKRPGDQIQQIDTGLTDFDSLIMTQYQLVASIAQMPATKLLKTTPKGFNATGEFELKDYIQTLQAIQENDMKPLIERHNLLLAKSRYNKKMEITVKFNPIDMPTEADKASINQATASTLSTLTQAGIISAEEAREHLKKDETAGFPTIDVESTPEDENQIAETMQALMAGNQQKQEPTEEEDIQKKNDVATDSAEFKESEHPRDDSGKFTDKGSGRSPKTKTDIKKETSQFSPAFLTYSKDSGSKNSNTIQKYLEKEGANRNMFLYFLHNNTKSLSEEEKEAIDEYTGRGYVGINSYLRGQLTSEDLYEEDEDMLIDTIENLSRAADKPFPYDMLLTRYTSLAEFGLNEDSSVQKVKEKLEGETVTLEAFTSTTTKEQPTFANNKTVTLKITAPAGTKGIDLTALSSAYGGFNASPENSEDEVLLQKGTEIKINNVTFENGKTVINAQVIIDGEYTPPYLDTDKLIEEWKQAGVQEPNDTNNELNKAKEALKETKIKKQQKTDAAIVLACCEIKAEAVHEGATNEEAGHAFEFEKGTESLQQLKNNKELLDFLRKYNDIYKESLNASESFFENLINELKGTSVTSVDRYILKCQIDNCITDVKEKGISTQRISELKNEFLTKLEISPESFKDLKRKLTRSK